MGKFKLFSQRKYLAPCFRNGTKIKIPSEIKLPLGSYGSLARTCRWEMQLKMQLNQSLINNDFQLIHNINKSFVLLLCIATSVKSMWVYLALGSMLHNAAFWPSFVLFCLFCICLTRFNITHFWIITPPK